MQNVYHDYVLAIAVSFDTSTEACISTRGAFIFSAVYVKLQVQCKVSHDTCTLTN